MKVNGGLGKGEKTINTRVRERLDRFMATSEWFTLFSQATVSHLLRYKSDHCPIVVRFIKHTKRRGVGSRGFKFETAWLLEEGCEDVVRDAWQRAVNSNVLAKIGEVRGGLVQSVLRHMGLLVSSYMNAQLTKPYTNAEIFEALTQMHPCKAPGLDGMHAIFFQKFWHIVGDDVAEFVINILHESKMPANVNKTNIVMFPKVRDPTELAQYRPISLCNVVYKLVSKAIVIRLKNILSDLVSENHSAFVPGRKITYNALIAMELLHTMKHRNKYRRGVIAMKLDMSKAYDSGVGVPEEIIVDNGF